jgi:membrane-associated phospholipid phosphatase
MAWYRRIDGMKEATYRKMTESVRKIPGTAKLIRYMDRFIVLAVALAYLLLLAYLFGMRDYDMLLRCVLVPGVAFVGVSIFRSLYPSRRPYEELDIEPLIPKETKGKSFPSRHVFSVFIIGMTFGLIRWQAAAVIFGLGVVLGALRVLAGVHYLRDVLAGAVMAVMIGGIAFALWR